MTGTREHHMLKQVRETRASRHLVLRTNVIPNVDSNSWRRVILGKNDGETVRKFIGFKRELDRVGSRALLLAERRQVQRDGQHEGQN